MSSLALMRWLEGAPNRYDAGMRWITFGAVTKLHQAAADAAVRARGDRVLEIGCGTGSVTALLVARGARVTALDSSAAMLELARARIAPEAAVEFLEQTAAEIDRFEEASFEAVVLSLCLSDMSQSERAFVLREAARLLVSDGRLIAADEVRAPRGWRRVVQSMGRLPQAAIGWLLVGSISRPLPDLAGELRAAGLEIARQRAWLGGSLALAEARRPKCD